MSNKQYEEQISIAGHNGKVIVENHFYKPQRKEDVNEKIFYELANGSRTVDGTIAEPLKALNQLQPYIPDYLGSKLPGSLPEAKEHDPTIVGYLVLDNLFAKYKKPAIMDIKMSLPSRPTDLTLEGSCNLLGCYVSGVITEGLTLRHRYNNWLGRNKPVGYFFNVLQQFFTRLPGTTEQKTGLLQKLRNLTSTLESLSNNGFHFASSSLLFLHESDKSVANPHPPDFYFIDFERCYYRDCPISTIVDLKPVKSLSLPVQMAIQRVGDRSPEEPVSPSYVTSSNTEYKPTFNLNPFRIVYHTMRRHLFPEENLVTVYLVRHGERHDYSDFSWAPKSPHPHDAHLSEAGQRQSEDFVHRLGHLNIHRLVSAPMQRAILGCEALSRIARTPVCVEPGFCEFLCSITRTRVPSFFSRDVSITPYVDESYKPKWGSIKLESWPDVFIRSGKAVKDLIEDCRGKGDLVIVSHRSTLQTVFAALLPEWEHDTKLEYGGIAMICEIEPHKFEMVTFNELNHLRDRINSPSSNPFRHIEGYYEDLSWNSYKSTAELWSNAADGEGDNVANGNGHANGDNSHSNGDTPKKRGRDDGEDSIGNGASKAFKAE